jgi:radical SAM protein with 4Fe4S-binding SPASM domain
MIAPRSDKPKMVALEATRQCNLSCPHCYSAATNRPVNELTTAEYLQIIDQLADLGSEWAGWTGGEPLLRTDLEELVGHASKRGFSRQGITTNGILLNETRAKALKDAGMTSVQISIDGSTAEKNREMRRATLEDFETVLQAIRICHSVGLQVDLAMLLGRATLEDAEPFLELANREKVTHVRFCGFVPSGRGKRSDVVERLMFNGKLGELKKFVSEAVYFNKPYAMFDPAFGPTAPDYEFHECIAGIEMLYISCTGDVYPCTSLLDKRFLVGNLREKSLAEIWNEPKMTEIANFPRETIHGHCRECDKFEGCRGACRGVTYAHTGDLNASFPVCLKQA